MFLIYRLISHCNTKFLLQFRRLDYGRPSLPVEAERAGADRQGPPPPKVHPRKVHQRLLQHQDKHG
jgi:hypothetical protein